MRFWNALWKFEWGLASIGAGTCLFLIMMITVLSVFGRYVLHVDLIPGAYNIVERVLFPLLVFWAMPVAHREGIFPRLETIPDMLPERGRTIVSIFVVAVEAVIYAIVLWFATRFFLNAYSTVRTMQISSSFWPLWPVLAMMPLAFGLMLIEMVRLIVRDVRSLLGTKSVEQV